MSSGNLPGASLSESGRTGAAQAERLRRLKGMKLFATGLLLLMAIIFVIAYLLEDDHPWLGYVRAAAEAGMVGALADWFAVTALFRHPLRLPIPHTAIIPTRKDAIGSSLSEFVATNFLSEEVVREKLSRLSLAEKAGGFLIESSTIATAGNHGIDGRSTGAARVSAEIAGAARGLMNVLRDDDVAAMLETIARRKIGNTQVGPLLGRIAEDVFARGDHHDLVNTLVDRAYTWVYDNPSAVERLVTERAPSWTPKFLDERIADRIYRELASFLLAIKNDPQHQVRQALDKFLLQFADDLQHDPKTMAKADAVKERLLANASVRSLAGSAWRSAKNALVESLQDENSELRTSMTAALTGLGVRLRSDPALAGKIDNWVADGAGYLARHHSRSITGIIDETIARWDGEATSARIELMVGRDLQFIRINGTVVGALAGLVIYTLAKWLL